MNNSQAGPVTIIAVVLIAALAIIGSIFSPTNIILILGFATSTIAAILAWGQARANYDLAKETHDLVNSKSTQLVEEVRAASLAKGKLEGPDPVDKPPTP